jgi:phosphoglycolate phosphatase
MHTIKAIAIDLDGTLLDTINDLSAAANYTLTEMGLATVPIETLRTFVGKGKAMHLRRSLAATLGRAATDSEMTQAMAIYEVQYRAHLNDQTLPYPGVLHGLKAFKSRGLPLACVTNKSRSFTEVLLQVQGLSPYFDTLVCGDDLPTSKPDPAMLTYTAGYFKVKPSELLMLGDSGNDAESARNAGCPVLLCNYGYTEGVPLTDIPNDGIIASFLDVLPYLSP